MLNVGHLKADDATANEQEVYNAFLVKASEIFATIKNELLSDTPTAYKDLEEEYQAYESYIVNNMLMSDTGILDADAIDKTDLSTRSGRRMRRSAEGISDLCDSAELA